MGRSNDPGGDLTVFENTELPLTYRDGLSKAQRREATLHALERVGMAHRLNHYPSQLSGGQQQRAGIARSLVRDPDSFWPTSRRATSIRATAMR